VILVEWLRGYGHWVRDVLVWTKARLLFRNEILATDGSGKQRPAHPDEARRLGDQPVEVRSRSGTQPSRLPLTGTKAVELSVGDPDRAAECSGLAHNPALAREHTCEHYDDDDQVDTEHGEQRDQHGSHVLLYRFV